MGDKFLKWYTGLVTCCMEYVVTSILVAGMLAASLLLHFSTYSIFGLYISTLETQIIAAAIRLAPQS
jgi:hypothetical protein